jgi:hypothetical protein
MVKLSGVAGVHSDGADGASVAWEEVVIISPERLKVRWVRLQGYVRSHWRESARYVFPSDA